MVPETLIEHDPNQRSYPTNCPSCEALQGRAVRVSSIKGQLQQFNVDMYCSICAHRWLDVVGLPDVRLNPKLGL